MMDNLFSLSFSNPVIWFVSGVVLARIVEGLFDLGVVKTKNVVLRHLTKMSEAKKNERKKRVALMAGNSNVIHFYATQANLFGHMAMLFFVLGALGTSMPYGDAASYYINLYVAASTGIFLIVACSCLFRSLELTQDIGRAVVVDDSTSNPPTDDNVTPL